ncbi:hypothetical protein PGIGA_G00164970, partial [Pangasianodon gigas]|nr:hypothetical protein [Pangasianodon gigas]
DKVQTQKQTHTDKGKKNRTFTIFLRWNWCGDLRELRMKTLLIFILCLISVTYVQTQDVESPMWPTQTNASSASTAQPDQNYSSVGKLSSPL